MTPAYTPPYPVGIIPYINMAPYAQMGPPRDCEFIPCVPSESVAAMESGRILAAAVPVGALPRLAPLVRPVGNHGIAADGLSMSVLFFSPLPFSAVRAPQKVRLTPESASSVRLLMLLFGYIHGFDALPGPAAAGEAAAGELVIGDAALCRAYRSMEDGPGVGYITDLATQWRVVHGLPFVFARWVIRRDAPEAAEAAIARWLADFTAREPELIEKAAPAAADRLCLATNVVGRYLRVIRRTLTEADREGEALFLKEVARCNLAKLPEAPLNPVETAVAAVGGRR